MMSHPVFILCLRWLLCVGLGASLAASAQNAKPNAEAACPPVLQHTVERLQDEKPQNLCQYAGQVVVVVNTASYCGFTPQYKSLEALYSRYKDKGLVVLGFPSNDFAQEPGNNQKIADFCENTYGVKFPMFSKTTVRGQDASPLFKQLSKITDWHPMLTRDLHQQWIFLDHQHRLARLGQTAEYPPHSRTIAKNQARCTES